MGRTEQQQPVVGPALTTPGACRSGPAVPGGGQSVVNPRPARPQRGATGDFAYNSWRCRRPGARQRLRPSVVTRPVAKGSTAYQAPISSARLPSQTPQPDSPAGLPSQTPQPDSPAGLPSQTRQPDSPARLPSQTPQPDSPARLLSPSPHAVMPGRSARWASGAFGRRRRGASRVPLDWSRVSRPGGRGRRLRKWATG